MAIKQIRAQGIDALNLATSLLQRVRLADPLAGVWEAADVQWTWRNSRESDDIEQIFWVDEHGPVAGVYATSRATGRWQVDPFMVPGIASISSNDVWQTVRELGDQYAPNNFDVPISDNDSTFRKYATNAGFTTGESDSTAWMSAADTPDVTTLAEGFTIVDRTQRSDQPHPMASRVGDDIAARLAQVSLYDPWLDLAIEAPDGRNAAYILFWFDPVTKVGLIEPVRTEDEFQRKGLAKALITFGMNRLAEKGAERLKISWENEFAGDLYLKVGFKLESTSTWFESKRL